MSMDAIVSVCEDWGIGANNQLLIENRADMRRFVQLTRGATVIMGRKTYEGLIVAPLKGRRNIVVTSDESYEPQWRRERDDISSVVAVHSPEEALELLDNNSPAWLIGGESLYRQLLFSCKHVYVTLNHTTVTGTDAFFPKLDEDSRWKLISREDGGVTEEGISFEYLCFEQIMA